RRDLRLVDDRVAPVVEADQLGEQLGAQAVRLAGDRVDAEPGAHRCRLRVLTGVSPPRPLGAPSARRPGTPPAGRRTVLAGGSRSPWRTPIARWRRSEPHHRGDDTRLVRGLRRSSATPGRARTHRPRLTR